MLDAIAKIKAKHRRPVVRLGAIFAFDQFGGLSGAKRNVPPSL